MKKTFLALGLLVSLSTFAQERKKDSLILQITMDTTTFKNVLKLIDENIDSRTLTGKMVKDNIMAPLMNYQLVADKPKEQIKPIKK